MKSLITFINEKQNFIIKGHTTKQDADYIDLDLPSGTKWASCNIGADKPEDYGLLFQWGRTDGYKYEDKNHKFLYTNNYTSTSGTEYKKGDTLKPEDDAAYQTTKGRFRIPTIEEIIELITNTNLEWTELNGVKGMKFISKKDDSKWIFIPTNGGFDGGNWSFTKSYDNIYIWSNLAEYKKYSVSFNIEPKTYIRAYNFRYTGLAVRGVLNK